MALDSDLAQRLWNERYREELLNVARKNRYLHEDQDPDDLFQDMAVHVWLKSVNTFDADAVTFTNDVGRAFNSYLHQWLARYLANLSTKRETGKQTYFREKRRDLDAPSRGKEEGEEGATLLDRIADERKYDPEVAADLQMLYTRLPENLSGALQYIIDNIERGNLNKVMKDVRSKWGLTTKRLFNALMDEPEFVDFVTQI